MYDLITDYLGRILQNPANNIDFTATGGEAIRAFHLVNFLNFQKLPIRAIIIYSVPLLFTAILRDKNASDGLGTWLEYSNRSHSPFLSAPKLDDAI
jgi:hypothetical protein